MKIRNGFVSNSSSSSFVILLPENFDIETIDFQKVVDSLDYCDSNSEDVKESLKSLIKNKALWNEESYDTVDALHEILKPYIIAEVDGGPDEGKIILADRKRIKKILGI